MVLLFWSGINHAAERTCSVMQAWVAMRSWLEENALALEPGIERELMHHRDGSIAESSTPVTAARRMGHAPSCHLSGSRPTEDVVLVEQPCADVLFLTSAGTDISCLDACLLSTPGWNERIRALPLSCLEHPAQLDHYLNTTAESAQLIVVRLLGSRGHWSYGLEQLQRWRSGAPQRHLIVLAGTADQTNELHGLGSCSPELADQLAALLREGGIANMHQLLLALEAVLDGSPPIPESVAVVPCADPMPWDWRDEVGSTVGVVLYRAQFQAGDLTLAEALTAALRKQGLRPCLLGQRLRDHQFKPGHDLLKQQNCQLVITGTSFASVQANKRLGSPPGIAWIVDLATARAAAAAPNGRRAARGSIQWIFRCRW